MTYCIFCGRELEAHPMHVLHVGPMHPDPCYTTFKEEQDARQEYEAYTRRELDVPLHLVSWDKEEKW